MVQTRHEKRVNPQKSDGDHTNGLKPDNKGRFVWTEKDETELLIAGMKLMKAGFITDKRAGLSADALKILCDRPGLKGMTAANIREKWHNMKVYFDICWNHLKYPDKRKLRRKLHNFPLKFKALLRDKYPGRDELYFLKTLFHKDDDNGSIQGRVVIKSMPPEPHHENEDYQVPNFSMPASPVAAEHHVAVEAVQSSKKRKQHPTEHDEEEKRRSGVVDGAGTASALGGQQSLSNARVPSPSASRSPTQAALANRPEAFDLEAQQSLSSERMPMRQSASEARNV